MENSDAPTGEQLSSLLYRSAVVRPFGPDDLRDLEVRASAHNAKINVSGYLTYRSGSFTQYLEGQASAVSGLYQSIVNDDRHLVGTMIFLDIEERRFPGWSMRLLDPLWHPTGEALDAIDELLQVRDIRPDDSTISSALQDLLRQVMV